MNNLLTIQQAASLLGVSTKTLRRWEAKGVLVPQRTVGNQRRYSLSQIEKFQAKKMGASVPLQEDGEKAPAEIAPKVSESQDAELKDYSVGSQTDYWSQEFVKSVGSFKKLALSGGAIMLFVVISGLAFATIKAGGVDSNGLSRVLSMAGLGEGKNSQAEIAQEVGAEAKNVLGAGTQASNLLFGVNIPSEFAKNANFLESIKAAGIATLSGGIITGNADINAGTGELTASNVIYSLTEGEGIDITPGQTPTITNTGVLSLGGSTGDVVLTAGTGISISGTTISNTLTAGSTFKNIVVGSSTITAGSANDSLTFAVGQGLDISANTGNKTVTISPNGLTETSPSCVTTLNGIVTGTGTCQLGSEQWSVSNGTLYPSQGTLDVLIGGNPNLGTASANFAFINNSTGVPTFRISGQSVLTSTTLGSSVVNSSLTSVGTITSGVWNGTPIATTSGGTGNTSWLTGDLVYANATDTLTRLPIGPSSYVLSVIGGVPTWVAPGSVGAGCTNCVVVDPTTGQNIITPQTSGVAALTLRPNGGNILTIEPNGGGTDYAYVDQNGNFTFNDNLYFANGALGNLYSIDTNGNSYFAISKSNKIETGFVNGNIISTGSGTLDLNDETLTTNASLTLAGTDGKTLTVSGNTILGTDSITFEGTEVLSLTAGKNVTFGDSFTTSGAFPLTLTTIGNTNVTLPLGGLLLTATASSNQTIDSTQTTGAIFGIRSTSNPADERIGQLITLSGSSSPNAQKGIAFDLSGITGTNHIFDLFGTNGSWYVRATGAAAFSSIQTTNSTASINSSGVFLAANGTQGAPSYAFSNSTDTGFYLPGADTIGFSTDGTERARLTSIGALGLGTTTPIGLLNIEGSPPGKALAVFNYTGTDQNILVASSSGTTRLTLSNSGNLNLIGGVYQSGGTPGITVSTAACVTTAGGIVTGSASCPVGSTDSPFQSFGPTIIQNNLTQDLLLGGTSTAGAKFAFININPGSGVPTASISGTTGSNALSLTGDGNIFTNNSNTLTLGGGGTGDINLSIAGGNNLRINGTAGQTVGSASCVTTTNGIVTGTGTCQFGTEQWDVSQGAIYTGNSTLDFFLGGTSTASAKFAVLNINSGTPTASIAGNFVLGAGGTIQATANRTLTIGGDTTGNIALSPNNGSGGLVTVNGTFNSTGAIQTGATSRIDASGNLVNIGTTQFNSVTYTWPVSATAGYILQSGSTGATSTLSWVDPATLGTNYWDQSQGFLRPKISTVDFGIGGTTTDSAKFAVLNINGATSTPIASISATGGSNAGKGLSFSADGSIQSLRNNALTIGGNTTGNITFSPGNTANTLTVDSRGRVGVNIASPNHKLDVVSNNETAASFAIIAATGNLGGSATSQYGILSAPKSTATTTNLYANASIAQTAASAITLTNGYAYYATNASAGSGSTITNNYGIFIEDMTTGTNDYGLVIAGADTQALWIGSGADNTDAANGIAFGSSRDTNLYRSASDTLKTDDRFSVATLNSNASNVLCYDGSNILSTCAAGTFGVGTNYWRASSDGKAIVPINSTLDLLVGGDTTASSKFAFINNAGGTPTASISANSGNNSIYLTGDGTLAATNRGTLTIGNSSAYNTTGNVLINPNGTGNVGIGTTNPTALFSVGSSSPFRVDNSGNVTGNKFNNVTITNGGTGPTTLTIADGKTARFDEDFLSQGASITFTASTTTGVDLPLSGTGTLLTDDPLTYSQVIASSKLSGTGTSGIFAITNSGTSLGGALSGLHIALNPTDSQGNTVTGLSFSTTCGSTSCTAIDISGTSGNWSILANGQGKFTSIVPTSGTTSGPFGWIQRNSGALSPTNITDDLLLGGISTTAARIAFKGIASGNTPTASLSAHSGLTGLVLGADGTIQSLQNATLTIGGSTTGIVNIPEIITGGTWNGNTIGYQYGGTGQSSYTAGDLLYANASGDLVKLPKGSQNEVLFIGAGPNFLPEWGTVLGGPTASCTNCVITDPTITEANIIAASASGVIPLTVRGSADGTTNIFRVQNNIGDTTYFNINNAGKITTGVWEGTPIATSSGGTGQTGYIGGDLLYASGPTSLSPLHIGSTNQVLAVSSGGVPVWSTVSGGSGLCSNCVVNDPSTSSVNTINPTSGVVPLTLRANGADILRIQSNLGGTTHAYVNSSGDFVFNDNLYFANGAQNNLYNIDTNGNSRFAIDKSNKVETGFVNGNIISTGSGTLTLNSATLNVLNSITLDSSLSTNTLLLNASISASAHSLNFNTGGGLGNTETLNLTAGKDVSFGNSFTTAGSNSIILRSNGTDTDVSLPVSGTGTLLTTSPLTNSQVITSTKTSGTGTGAIFAINNLTNPTGAITGLHINLHPISSGGSFTQTGLSFFTGCPTGTCGTLYDIAGTNTSWYIKPDGTALFGNVTSSSSSGTFGWLQRNSGALSPTNITDDLLLGGISTSTAKFAFYNNIGSGVPTASLSSGINSGTYLTASGILATRANQSLTLGGSETGDIVLNNPTFGSATGKNSVLFGRESTGVLGTTTTTSSNLCFMSGSSAPVWATCPGAGAGGGSLWSENAGENALYPTTIGYKVGVGTTTGSEITSSLYVTRNLASGALGKALAVFNQTESQDIIAASASGTPKFVVTNGGSLQLATGQTIDTIGNGTLGIGTANTTDITIGRSGQNITLPTFTKNGGLLYTNGSGLLTQLTAQGTAGDCLVSGGDGGLPSFSNCASAAGDDWEFQGGALFPRYASVADLLLGSGATSSAEFSVTGILGGTPVASVAATTSVNAGGISLTAASSTIQSLNMNTLTLGGASTGNIIIDSGSGAITLSDATNITSNLTVAGTTGLTLSGSGADLLFNGGSTNTISSTGTLEIGAHTLTGAITGNGQNITGVANLSATGTITFSNSTFITGNNNVLSSANTSGEIGVSSTNTSGLCLISGTSTPAWGTCAVGDSVNWWKPTSDGKAITPLNSTLDLLIGGDSTTAAKFAFINVAGVGSTQQPTASISANSNNNAIYLTGDGTLATAKRGTLTIGNSSTYNTTGNVLIHPNATFTGTTATGGRLGIGTSTPNNMIQVANLINFDNSNTSTGLGFRTLRGTATQNTGIGYEALSSLSLSGGGNTAVGYQALTANTSGISNLALGSSALSANNTGSSNTAIGNAALAGNQSGNFNVGIGSDALSVNTSSGNVAIGSSALQGNVGGSTNTAIGFNAGYAGAGTTTYANTSGSNNTFIGYNAGPFSASQRNNMTAIGAFAVVDQANSLVLGGISTSAYAVNVGIGTATPSAVLDIQGGNRGGNASLIVNQTGVNTNDIISASASGNTRFRVRNTGELVFADNNSSFFGTLDLATLTGNSTYNFPDLAGSSATVCLSTNNCNYSQGANYWQIVSAGGAIAPTIDNLDVLVGGQSTTAAKFAITGVNSARGNQVATLSGRLVLDSSAATIQTTNFQALTLGGDKTGFVNIANKSGNPFTTFDTTNGKVGINTTAPTALFSVGTSSPFTVTDTGAVSALTYNGNTITAGAGTLTLAGNTLTLAKNFSTAGSQNITITSPSGNPANVTLPETGTLLTSISSIAQSIDSTQTSGNIFGLTDSGTDYSGNITGFDLTLDKAGATNKYGIKFNISGGTNVYDIYGTGGWYIKPDGTALFGSVSTSSSSGVFGWLQRNNGALAPANITDDLLLGGISTATAKFAFINNIGSGTPTASISAGVAGATYVTANGNIGTTAWQTLNLGGATTGDINFKPGNRQALLLSTNGTVTIGTTIQSSQLYVSRPLGFGATGKALAIFDQIENQDLFTASASGVTRFTVNNSGDIVNSGNITAAGTTGISLTGNNAGISFSGTGAHTIAAAAGQLTLGGTVYLSGSGYTTDNNNILYTTQTTGILSAAVTNTSGQCLLSGASNPAWADCSDDWNLSAGAISPRYATVTDLLLGSNATSSSKFAFMNVGSGTPTASISAGTANNWTYITGDGTLATTNKQTLNIGSASTGNIVMDTGVNNQIFIGGTNATAVNIGRASQYTNVLGQLEVTGNSFFNDKMISSLPNTGFNALDVLIDGHSEPYFRIRGNGTLDWGPGSSTVPDTILYRNGANTLKTDGNFQVGRQLFVSGDPGHNALAIFNQTGTNANDYIFSASSSGSTKFVINNIGRVGIGSSSPIGLLQLSGNAGNNASLIVDNTGVTTSDLFAASSSGTTKFRIANDGSFLSLGHGAVGAQSSINSTSVLRLHEDKFLSSSPYNFYGLDIAGTYGSSDDGNPYSVLGAYIHPTIALGDLSIGNSEAGGLRVDVSTDTTNCFGSYACAGKLFGIDASVKIENQFISVQSLPVDVIRASVSAALDNNNNQFNLFHAVNSTLSNSSSYIAGLYIDAFTSGSTSGRYGIYQAGTTATDSNYNILAANTTIGGITNPTATLDLVGSATVSGNLNFTGASSKIQQVKNQTLALGGDSTGNITFSPHNLNLLTLDGTSTGGVTITPHTGQTTGYALNINQPIATGLVLGSGGLYSATATGSSGTSSNWSGTLNNIQLDMTKSNGGNLTESGNIFAARLNYRNSGTNGANTKTLSGSIGKFERLVNNFGAAGLTSVTGDVLVVSDWVNLTGSYGTFTNTSNIANFYRNCPTGVTCSGALLNLGSYGAGTDSIGLNISRGSGILSTDIKLQNSATITNITNGVVDLAGKLHVTGSTAQAGSSQQPLKNSGIGTPSTSGSDWNMGYKFTPNKDGVITQLGLNCDTGTRTVRLYTIGGTLLTSASVAAGGVGTWVYTSITPVAVSAGSSYVVAVRSGAGNYCLKTSFATPVTVGDVTINDSRYIAASDNMPNTTDTANMYGLADVTFVPLANYAAVFDGRVLIGTSSSNFMLQVADTQTATAAALFENLDTGSNADGIAIRLGFTGNTSTTNYWAAFLSGSGRILGKIRGGNNISQTAANTVVYDANGGDYAEYYKKADPDENIDYGDVVCLAKAGGVTKCSAENSSLLGVMSYTAGFVGNGGHGDDPDYILVGIVGQLETKVASESSALSPSDAITMSLTEPGKIKKATQAGYALGHAMGDYDPSSVEIIPGEVAGKASGKVMISLNPTWYDPGVYVNSDGSINNPYAQFTAEEAETLRGLASQSASSSANFDLANDPLFQDVQDRVATTETTLAVLGERTSTAEGRISDLQNSVANLASQSAFLTEMLATMSGGQQASGSGQFADLTDLDIENATISGDLNVLGRTTLTDLGVTGNITAGLLSIHGLDSALNGGSGGASINSIGDLNLQSNGLGGINILAGKVMIDTDGNIKTAGDITAKKLKIDTTTDEDAASLGTGTLPSGDTTIYIDTTAVTNKSRIFLTPTTQTGGKQLVVSDKDAGQGFEVSISGTHTSDIKFDWFIVDEK